MSSWRNSATRTYSAVYHGMRISTCSSQNCPPALQIPSLPRRVRRRPQVHEVEVHPLDLRPDEVDAGEVGFTDLFRRLEGVVEGVVGVEAGLAAFGGGEAADQAAAGGAGVEGAAAEVGAAQVRPRPVHLRQAGVAQVGGAEVGA